MWRGTLHEALEVQLRVVEAVHRLRRRRLEGAPDFGGRAHDAHAAAASAATRLDHHREADPLRFTLRVGDAGQRLRAGQQRQSEAHSHLSRAELVAPRAHRVRTWADEGQPATPDDLRELGVLAQEPVARMNRVRAADLRRADDRRDVQVALLRGRRADADRLVGEANVERVGVRLRVDRHRRDVELPTRANDAHRDLAAVGYEDLREHGRARNDSNPCAS